DHQALGHLRDGGVEAGALALGLFAGAVVFRQVADELDDARRVVGLVGDRVYADGDRVGGDHAGGQLNERPLGLVAQVTDGTGGRRPRLPAFVDNLADAATNHLLGRQRAGLVEGAVGAHQAVVAVDQQDLIGHRVEGRLP